LHGRLCGRLHGRVCMVVCVCLVARVVPHRQVLCAQPAGRQLKRIRHRLHNRCVTSERERERVCVCVCERKRERERECVCVCVCVSEREIAIGT
jgi:hypothetical protein